MVVDLLCTEEGWFVTYTLNGKRVDEAGPFSEEWEAEDCARRA